jgi:hypothetical protein
MNCARYVPAAALAVAAVSAGLAGLAQQPTQPKDAPAAAQKPTADQKPAADQKAIARTRDTVKMLDDVYKTMIVLITDEYVHAEDDTAAATAAVALFDAIEKKGWHSVRLVDATGDPYDPDNVPESDFEKEAIKKIKGGETYVDRVVEKDGKTYLLAATAIPVVMDRCVICHPHFKDVPKGQAIGALSYEVPIR